MATIKAKFKIGQKVWYIADGYVDSKVIKAIFIDKHDCVCYSMQSPIFAELNYSLKYDVVKGEDCLYLTKKALIKSIEDTEDYE